MEEVFQRGCGAALGKPFQMSGCHDVVRSLCCDVGVGVG